MEVTRKLREKMKHPKLLNNLIFIGKSFGYNLELYLLFFYFKSIEITANNFWVDQHSCPTKLVSPLLNFICKLLKYKKKYNP